MRVRHVITVGFLLAAAGCDNRGGLGFDQNDGGGTGGTGGSKGGTGGSTTDAGPRVCPAVLCPAIACPYGAATDTQGCPTCGCTTPVCPGVTCALYCASGFQHDANGCSICACNPGACTTAECGGGPPPSPVRTCPDGTTAPPVCRRNAAGACGWVDSQCPGDCGKATTPGACAALGTCTWLQPGCTPPSIPAAGCYPIDYLGCAEKMFTCPGGRQCQSRTVNPCAGYTSPGVPPATGTGAGGGAGSPPQGGGSDRIAIPACTTCAQTISICL